MEARAPRQSQVRRVRGPGKVALHAEATPRGTLSQGLCCFIGTVYGATDRYVGVILGIPATGGPLTALDRCKSQSIPRSWGLGNHGHTGLYTWIVLLLCGLWSLGLPENLDSRLCSCLCSIC